MGMSLSRYKNLWDNHPRMRAELLRIARFGLVGTVCSAVHYGVYCLFALFSNYNVSYTAGYMVGLICNYILTTYFTFRKSPSKRNVAGFIASHAVNYLLEIGLFNLFLYAGVGKWLAPVLSMLIAIPVNFALLHFVYLYKRK